MSMLAERPVRAAYRVIGKERTPPLDWVHLAKSMIFIAWLLFPAAWIMAQLVNWLLNGLPH